MSSLGFQTNDSPPKRCFDRFARAEGLGAGEYLLGAGAEEDGGVDGLGEGGSLGESESRFAMGVAKENEVE